MNKSLKNIRQIQALVVMLLAIFVSALQAAALPAQSGNSFDVRVSGSGLTSNILVSAGDQIEVSASGQIRVGFFAGNSSPSGINGYRQFNVVATAQHAALLVRVSGESQWRVVGQSLNFIAGKAGTLEFLVNDSNVGDNSGAYAVHVQVQAGDKPPSADLAAYKALNKSKYKQLYRLDFDEDNTSKDAYTKNGEFVTLDANEDWYTPYSCFIDQSSDYIIEAAIKLEAHTTYWGISWGGDHGLQEKPSGNTFIVHAVNNLVAFRKYQKDAVADFVPFMDPQAMLKTTEYNLFRVEKSAERVALFLNDSLVGLIPAPEFTGHQLGFVTGGRIRVDYIEVRQNQKIAEISNSSKKLKNINLGPNVNDVGSDYNPVISADGSVLYFTRRDFDGNTVDPAMEDVWISNKLADGSWSKAVNAGPKLNNASHNAVYSLSADANTLYISNPQTYLRGWGQSNYSNASGWMGVSHLTANGWSTPQSTVDDAYFNNGFLQILCIAPDNKTMVLSVQRNDSFGNNDLYVCFRKSDGNWGAPVNLGSTINTLGEEVSAFIASDNTSMYFSSDGRPGYGGLDVFISRRLDSTWTNWSEPLNLGPQINTHAAERDYKLTARGEHAYYASAKKGGFGKTDVYRVELPEAAKPLPTFLVRGKVFNATTGEPIAAEIFYEALSSGKELGTARSRPGDGSYTITLPSGEEYGFLAQLPGYFATSQNIDGRKLKSYQEVERDLYLTPLEVGANIRLNNLFFDTGKHELRRTSHAELRRLVSVLKANPGMQIEIWGHTDDVGNQQYNLTLSENRAAAVLEFLVQEGIARTRLSKRGFGEDSPLSANDSAAARQENRRVEFQIVSLK